MANQELNADFKVEMLLNSAILLEGKKEESSLALNCASDCIMKRTRFTHLKHEVPLLYSEANKSYAYEGSLIKCSGNSEGENIYESSVDTVSLGDIALPWHR